MFEHRSHFQRTAPPEEIAAGWAIEKQRGLSARGQAKRDAWLAKDPQNAELLRAAESALGLLDRHAGQPEILALRRAALVARPERQRLSGRVLAAAIGGVLVPSVAFWALYVGGHASGTLANSGERPTAVSEGGPASTRYSTLIGERSTIALPDGSTMVLNTASTAEVRYSPGERRIQLLQGQALFTVAHGQSAPFRVFAGDRVITAVGTVFDVRLEGRRVEVGMLEGTVQVGTRNSLMRGLGLPSGERLSAGETLVAAPAEPVRVRTADVERMASWRSGLLMFDDTPLAAAIAEVNRYTANPVVLVDAAAADYRVTGTFRVGESERFARTMTQLFPLEIERAEDGNTVLRRRPPDR